MRWLKRAVLIVLVAVPVLVMASLCFLSAVAQGIIFIPCSDVTDSNIEQLFADMQSELQNEDYAAAFLHMSPTYRQSHTREDFKFWMDPTWFTLRPHYYLETAGNRAKVYPRSCHAFDLMSGPIFDLVQLDGVWYFTGTYDWPLD